MEVSSRQQIYVFALCVVTGIICGFFFDLQRSLRRIKSSGSFRTTLEDILFTMVCALLIIGGGFYFNSGQIRYYQIMGVLSGLMFYAAFLSRAVMKLIGVIYACVTRFILIPIVKLFKILCVPFVKIYHISKKLLLRIGVLIKKIFKCMKIGKKRLKKRIKML